MRLGNALVKEGHDVILTYGAQCSPAVTQSMGACRPTFPLVAVDTEFWLDVCKIDECAAALRQYESCQLDDFLLQYSYEIRDALPWSPDIILSISPAEHFKLVFPEARICYFELHPFSKRPFPEALYFDPVSPQAGAFIAQHKDDILLDCKKSLLRPEWIGGYRANLLALSVSNSPYAHSLRTFRDRYPSLALYPAQGRLSYEFKLQTNLQSNAEVIASISHRLPSGWGLVVTQHSDSNAALSPRDIEMLANRYSNVLMLPSVNWDASSSFWAAGLCDALLTVATKASWLGLLLGLPTFTVGKRAEFFTKIYSETSLTNLDGSRATVTEHDMLLAWIMSRYTLFLDDLHDAPFVTSMIMDLVGDSELRSARFSPRYSMEQIQRRLEQALEKELQMPRKGQKVATLPFWAQPPGGFDVSLQLLKDHRYESHGIDLCKFVSQGVAGDGLILSLAYLKIPLPPMPSNQALGFEIDVCIGHAAADYAPVVWTGQMARAWNQGRSLCLYYHSPTESLVLSATLNGNDVSVQTPPGTWKIGVWVHLSCHVDCTRGLMLGAIDGTVLIVEPIIGTEALTPDALVFGADGHGLENAVNWSLKMANIRCSFPVTESSEGSASYPIDG